MKTKEITTVMEVGYDDPKTIDFGDAEIIVGLIFNLEDVGIGSYEFWGAKETDSRFEAVYDGIEFIKIGGVSVVKDSPTWNAIVTDVESNQDFIDRHESDAYDALQDSRYPDPDSEYDRINDR